MADDRFNIVPNVGVASAKCFHDQFGQAEDTNVAIRTFGGLAVWLEDAARPGEGMAESNTAIQKLRFETRTVEALLVYLVCQGRPLGRDVMAELLWPERTQHQAHANLRMALHRLRQQLDPYFLVTRQHVALNPDAGLGLDVGHFEAAC